MGIGDSRPLPPVPKEEDKDIDFNEDTIDVPPPPEPKADPDIRENVEGSTLYNVENVTTEYTEIKDAIVDKSNATGKTYVYRDQEFPSESISLYYSSRPPSRWDTIKWKRPTDISRDPRLLTDGVGSEDIVQGQLGDCWWLASCAAISRSATHIKRIIPQDQKMTGPDYVGMFHFRFWRYGKWVDVIVDDQLPTMNGFLCFGRSADKNEFWLPLLEKAYAKLHGSYQAIEGGFTQDGMEDLTGGIAINYDLGRKTPDSLFTILYKAFRNESFVSAGIGGSGNIEDRFTGLVSAHAYAMLKVARAAYEGGYVDLVKFRNPWGGSTEWRGDWSDSSSKWDTMDESVKQQLGYADKDNGEWWMSYDDFTTYFNDVTICTVGPDFDADGAPSGDKWLLSTINGEWKSGVSAGGSRNDIYSYATNPQYLLYLQEADDYDPDEDSPAEKGKCSVLAGLMQEYRRSGKEDGLDNLYISLNIFKVSQPPRTRLDARFFSRNREVATTSTYVNRREVTITAELDPGYYVIVPSCFNSGDSGTFLIRVFTEKNVDIQEITG
ncbi:calpain-A-like [Clavelina lepadiformis]|uniref:calpain-A-like n=1 Tax=Clavelina lepadiformis TaxID=159417 RepID=UPI0040423CEA